MATDQEYKYEEISVQVESKGELFEAKGKKILQYGWKLYEECFKNDQGMAMEEFCASEKEFPEVIKETIFRCVPVQKTVHYTTPPKEYTEDTLLAAMETAGNKDFEKETEKKGLGTPATRACIFEICHKKRKTDFLYRRWKTPDRSRSGLFEIGSTYSGMGKQAVGNGKGKSDGSKFFRRKQRNGDVSDLRLQETFIRADP